MPNEIIFYNGFNLLVDLIIAVTVGFFAYRSGKGLLLSTALSTGCGECLCWGLWACVYMGKALLYTHKPQHKPFLRVGRVALVQSCE